MTRRPDPGNFLDPYFSWLLQDEPTLIPPLRGLRVSSSCNRVVRRILEAVKRLEFGAAADAAWALRDDAEHAGLLAEVTVAWCQVALGHSAAADGLLRQAIGQAPDAAVIDFLHELRAINFLCVGRYEEARQALASLSRPAGDAARPLAAFVDSASDSAAVGCPLRRPDRVTPVDPRARYIPFVERFLGYCEPSLQRLTLRVDGVDVPVLDGDSALMSVKHKAVASSYVFTRQLPFGPVVVKLILGYCGYDLWMERREYGLLRSLDAPFLPKPYGELHLPRTYLIVMERLDGQPLLPGKFYERMDVAVCELIPSLDRWKEVLGVLRQQCAFMSQHSLYHGDVSPDNILVTPHDVYLIDLGLATETTSCVEAEALHQEAICRLDAHMVRQFREVCPSWS